MDTCTHPSMQPCGLLEDGLHYEDWCCPDCDHVIYGPCHHRSLCRFDFCSIAAPADDAVLGSLPAPLHVA